MDIMISNQDNNVALLSRKLVYYENERYNPLTGGWGPKGLLPTDRKPFSNHTGSWGYSSIKEVEESLLSAGWKWDTDGAWEISRDVSTDAEGWSYAPDFNWYLNGGINDSKREAVVGNGNGTSSGSTVFTQGLQDGAEILSSENSYEPEGLVGGKSGSSVKQMMHFVRRRRQTRFQTFDPELLADFGSFTCDHCDLEELERLSAVLLNSLAQASLKAYPRNFTEAKCNKLKSSLIASLSLRGEFIHNGLYSSKVVASRLESFVGTLGNAWSAVSSMVSSGSPLEMLGRRTADIAHMHFSHEERRVIAGLIIRKHDINFEYHCPIPSCGHSCEYRVESCPNHQCGVIFSAKWASNHDAVCPQKILPCERACGDTCSRRLMVTHLDQACPLRPANCPYLDLGCMAALCHKDVPDHLETCMPSHLLLSLTRLQEQASVIRDLHSRVIDLEGANAKLAQQMTTVVASSAAAMTALEIQSHRQDKALREEAAVQKKLTSAVSSELHSHVSKHNSEISAINKSLAEIRPFLQALRK